MFSPFRFIHIWVSFLAYFIFYFLFPMVEDLDLSSVVFIFSLLLKNMSYFICVWFFLVLTFCLFVCLLWQSSGGIYYFLLVWWKGTGEDSPHSAPSKVNAWDPGKYLLIKQSPSIWASVLLFSNSSLWEQRESWWGSSVQALSPNISSRGIRLCGSWKGFTGNKEMRGPVHLNSPPWWLSPHCRAQPAFLCQKLVITVLLGPRTFSTTWA